MSTWDDGTKVAFGPLGLVGRIRAVIKVLMMALIIFGLMGPMILLRFAGFHTVSQSLVTLACRGVLRVIGLRVLSRGSPMQNGGAVVSNHCSWMDIFTLNAVQKVLFVAKAEVRGWALIGLIARSVGTVFIERKKSQAARQRDVIEARVLDGKKVLFFPEGTSTDGLRVLPFRSTLFAAFFSDKLKKTTWIQPVTVAYHAPDDMDSRVYGWWGGADFAPHLFIILAMPKQGWAEVIFHEPIKVSEVADRKELAKMCGDVVRTGLEDALKVG